MAVDKLVDSAQLDADLTTVANAIRTKGGTSAQLAFPAEFVSAIQAIPTGGGGASNIVTGTFKGTTTGAAMDITLPYTGTGYPIAVMIYPTGGANNSTAASGTNAYKWYTLIQRYAIAMWTMSKTEIDTAPSYNNPGLLNTLGVVMALYKNSASSATSYSRTGSQSSGNYGQTPSGTAIDCVTFKSATKMSVYIASTSYGFAANIEYTYYVIYSS